MKIVSETQDMIIVEDDGGFLNFIPKQKEQKPLSEEEERIKLEQYLDENEIFWF